MNFPQRVGPAGSVVTMATWGIRELEELEDETLRSGEHAATGARLARLADEGDLQGVSRAEVLARAGGQWQLAGQPAHAAELYHRAVDDGGAVHGDARAYLADALFDLGRAEEAMSWLARIRADEPSDPAVYHVAAETLEAQRDLAGAHDWATAGARLALRAERPSHVTLDMLLRTRFRARRDLGLPEDEYDEMLDDLSPAEEARSQGGTADM